MGYSPRGCRESDMTEYALLLLLSMHEIMHFCVCVCVCVCVYVCVNLCWPCEASASHEKTVTTVKGVSAFLYMRRYKNWAHRTHKISS